MEAVNPLQPRYSFSTGLFSSQRTTVLGQKKPKRRAVCFVSSHSGAPTCEIRFKARGAVGAEGLSARCNSSCTLE